MVKIAIKVLSQPRRGDIIFAIIVLLLCNRLWSHAQFKPYATHSWASSYL